jgi:signal transduction histidine kinase
MDVARAQDARKVVLMLSEFRPDSQASTDREEIIRSTLTQALRGGVDYYADFIDIDSFPDADYQTALRDFLGRKYKDTRFDAIIAVGPAALDFARENGVALFNGAPVVASTVDRDALQQTAVGPPVTGIVRRLDPIGTIDFILTLQPLTTRIIVIGGGTARPVKELTERQLRDSGRTIAVDYLFDLPMEELLMRLGALPERSAILYSAVTEDGTGKRFLSTEALTSIRSVANAPVYGIIANHLEYGIVGGSLLDTGIMAREVAELTVQQLRYGTSRAVPVRESQSIVRRANWRELRRWRLSEARLPSGTVVFYKEPSAWERYKPHIVGAISLFAFQTLMIAALLTQRARRRRAEAVILANEGVLRASYERIRNLAGRLITAQEAERARIGRELHDGVSQEVTALAIGLSSLKRCLREGDSVDVHEALSDLQRRTTALGDEIRHISHDLHPGVLHHVGLVAALREHCREFGRQHGIETTFMADNDLERIDTDAALTLYRVAQEALCNISKHSAAAHARVVLTRTGDFLELTIADDGHGFDAAHPGVDHTGLGLRSIDERVRLINGTVRLQSKRDFGTTLRVQVPLSMHKYAPCDTLSELATIQVRQKYKA